MDRDHPKPTLGKECNATKNPVIDEACFFIWENTIYKTATEDASFLAILIFLCLFIGAFFCASIVTILTWTQQRQQRRKAILRMRQNTMLTQV